jgi:ELWxxDGT repeat protein
MGHTNVRSWWWRKRKIRWEYASSRSRPYCRLVLEELEDRSMLSTAFMPTSVINLNGILLIQGQENGTQELWRSDGTAVGTFLLNAFVPTGVLEKTGVLENMLGSSNAVVNGMFFFESKDDNHGLELWKSDGTLNGTVMVKDINPGSGDSFPGNLTNVDGTLFFTAFNGVQSGLWKSDGTSAGTVEIAPVIPAGSMAGAHGTAYFQGGGKSGLQLWKSDGTVAGTGQVDLINPAGSSFPGYFATMNGTLYFTAVDSSGGTDPSLIYSLWKTDGTAAGTVRISAFYPDRGFAYPYLGTVVKGALYFTVYSGPYCCDPSRPASTWVGPTSTELWKTDGTTAGTVMLKSFDNNLPHALTNVSGNLFFTVDDGTHGQAIWKTDGSPDGTVMVRSFDQQTEGSNPGLLTDVNGTLYFTLFNGTQGLEIWKSDGSTAGTVEVTNLNLTAPDMNDFINFVNANGTLYFTDLDQQGKTELWKSDGTSAGTVLVAVLGNDSANLGIVFSGGSASSAGSAAPTTSQAAKSGGGFTLSADLSQAFEKLSNATVLLRAGGGLAQGSTPNQSTSVSPTDGSVSGDGHIVNTSPKTTSTATPLMRPGTASKRGDSFSFSTAANAPSIFELQDPASFFEV